MKDDFQKIYASIISWRSAAPAAVTPAVVEAAARYAAKMTLGIFADELPNTM